MAVLYSKTLRTAGLTGLAVLFLAGRADAQPVRVVSEFTRIRPDGQVVSYDRGARVREILSPAMARNAYSTYRIIVEPPPGQQYTIAIAQNPENSCEVRLYQEGYAKFGEEWIPDELKPQELPASATLASGQKVQTYLLDVFVPAGASDARFRLEVQAYVDGHWIIYPMEMRPRPISAPAKLALAGPLPPVDARSDSGVGALMRETVCKEKYPVKPGGAPTARALLMRNVRQDLKIGEGRMPSETFDGVVGMLLRAGGWKPSSKEFCAADAGAAPNGPEWWLRARDYLYQGLPVY